MNEMVFLLQTLKKET